MTRHRPSADPAISAFATLLLASTLVACTGGAPADPLGPGPRPAITVTQVTPASGPAAGGAAIVVEGAGFSPGDIVRLGGVAATEVQVLGATRLTAVSPAHAGGAVDVQVVAADGRTGTAAGAYAFVEPPVLSSLAPGHLPRAGGSVIIHGANFAPGAQVLFGVALASGAPEVSSATQLSAVAGAQEPGLVDVTVVNPDGQRSTLAAALRFDADPPPPPPPPAALALRALAPASGPESGGTVVTLSGEGFDPLATVTFGGAPATVTAHSATSITVATPPRAPGAVDVTVANPDGARATLPVAFTYVALPPAPPTIGAVEPVSGPETGGAVVVVTGTGFQPAAEVAFGGAPAAVLEALPARLTVLTPAHPAGAVEVVVRNPDGQVATRPAGYTYLAAPVLTLLAVSPSSGPTGGGTRITLSGSAFEPGAAVTVGGIAATAVSVAATSISATTPPHAAGVVAVSVRNPGGATASLPAAFAYLAPPAPTPVAASPSSGPDLGGTPVTVTGSGFQPGATVAFGDAAPVAGVVTSTSIVVAAPPHAAGAVDLVVINPDGQRGSLAAAFAYLPPPQLTGITPASGPAAGGAVATLTGAGLQPGAVVTFGRAQAVVTAASSSDLELLTPAHAAGLVDVRVTNPDGRQAALIGAYAYLSPPPPPPALASLTPATGPTLGGTTVVLTGSGFDATTSASFGGAAAAVTARSAGSLTVSTPAHGAGPADVVVVNGDGQTSILPGAFTFVAPPPPPPSLQAVTPSSGSTAGGTAATISGSNFTAGLTVKVAGTAAAVAAVTPTSVAFTTPPHAAGAAGVTVINPDGQSATLAGAFTYVAPPPPPPHLDGLSPIEGPDAGGTLVTLSGSGFAAGAAVAFGGAPAVVGTVADGSIVAQAPAHVAGLVDVTVTNPDGQASTLHGAFTFVAPPPPPPVLPAPVLASVLPASGPTAGGTVVALSGAHFQAGATVTLGGVSAVVGAVGAGTIELVTPAHAAGAVDVTVTNPDGQAVTLPAAFTYLVPPALASLAPTSGPTTGGTAATLSGTGFSAGATVAFGGAAATVVGRTATSVAVTTPAHAAGAVSVTVTNADGQVSTLAGGYTYVLPPPVVTSLAPASGTTLGGTSVTVTGSGFQAGATATLGGSPAAVSAVTAIGLTLVTPAHAAGPAALTVTNPDGQAATLASAFTYVTPPPPPPTLTALSPTNGPDAGGTAVTLTGGNLLAGATVTFGGSAGVVGAITATTIAVVTPPHLAGPADVVVTNPGGQSATLAAAFTFVSPPPPPVLSAVLPATGTTGGGTAVALTGAAFQAGATVRFGGVAAAVVSSAATAIAVTTPAHAAGAVDVSVTNPDGQSTTLPAAFTYVAPPPPPPVLSAISPVSGSTAGGTAVTLTGAAFSGTVTVTFGGAAAVVTASSASAVTATTPPHAAGAVDVVVTNADGQKATLPAAFGYVAPPPAPVLSGLSPASGPTSGGTHVVLSGGGFASGVAVSFGGAAATVQGVTATAVTVATPVHAAGAVAVTVTNPDGQASTLPAAFTYLAPPAAPALASATPASGTTAGGTEVVLAGAGFQAGATVTLGGVAAAVGGVTATAITLTTPPHAAGPVDVVVANPDGQQATLAGGFTYLAPPPPPAITGVTPNTGPLAGGTTVTIDGAAFVSGATLAFGGAAGTVTALSATAITVTTPPGAAGPVDVSVVNPDGQAFTFVGAYAYADPPPVGNPPSITSVAPTSGYVTGGTQVTITGRDFRAPDVLFGGVPATLVTATATSLLVLTPAHASGSVTVTVTNPDGTTASRANGYRFVPLPVLSPPTITAITPSTGPDTGNALVRIAGTNFFAGATVTFGGAPAFVQTLTATEIAVLTPQAPAGTVDVRVTNVDAQSATAVAGYAFVAPPPVVTAIGVRGSPQDGGGTQLMVGSGLQNTVGVSFGGTPATGLAYDAQFGNLTVTIPPSPLGPTADGFVDIVLVNRDGQTTTWPGFHYGNPPTATSFTPDTAPRDATVVITGFDFTADGTGPRVGLQVSFGGTPAVVTAKSSTSISVTVPKMNPGQYKIVVVNFDGQVGVAPGFFTAPGP